MNLPLKQPLTASERARLEAAGVDTHPAASTADDELARYPAAARAAAQSAESRQTSDPSERLRVPPRDVFAEQAEKAKAAEPMLKHIGGSNDDAFNLALARATGDAAWIVDAAERDRSIKFIGKALAGIAPRDEMEGMLAGQMVAMHMASLECSRRAMVPEQSLDARAMNLKAATRASQTYATLLGALDKHRGKGRQVVRVEHVHVAPGAQAIVGTVETGGGREIPKDGQQPHAPRLAHSAAPLAPMWGKDARRDVVPVAGDAERPLPHARRREPGSAKR